jgi:oxygen-independent coproporphyrinogen-3 oxidase
MNNHLVNKYNVQAPRYTSYPTVPFWNESNFDNTDWQKSMIKALSLYNDNEGISIYIHLPYCESLCTYCACNTRITINHKVEEPYINALIKEWQLYLKLLPQHPLINEIHLGGGTPTFFSPENLKKLIQTITSYTTIANKAHFSFEAHPANTTVQHLETLFDLGFTRLSLGIQDFNEKVQNAINRHQTYEQVYNITQLAKKIGYTSVNYDLIYGLPFQTEKIISETIQKVIELKPDRIAFYAYAHVPWIKPGQRRYNEHDLPKNEEKLKIYLTGKKLLLEAGYREVGMDHFALPNDELFMAKLNNTLHRNFMGYTTLRSKLLIGLGSSSISDVGIAFAQNHKTPETYIKTLQQGILPVTKGYILSVEDLIIRQHILNIMCKHETSWLKPQMQCKALFDGLFRLAELKKDGLIDLMYYKLKVTEEGKPFIRNICMALDAKLNELKPDKKIFSLAV